MAREDPQLKLRLTEEMKDRVVRAARDNNRSVNAEIVSRLEASFEREAGEPHLVDFVTEAMDARDGFAVLAEGSEAEKVIAAYDEAHRQAISALLKKFGVKSQGKP